MVYHCSFQPGLMCDRSYSGNGDSLNITDCCKIVPDPCCYYFIVAAHEATSYLAGLASESSFSTGQEYGLRVQVLSDAAAAIILLLLITSISVYKPWGKIRGSEGNNKPGKNFIFKDATAKKSWKIYAMVAIIALIVFILFKHLSGDAMHGY